MAHAAEPDGQGPTATPVRRTTGARSSPTRIRIRFNCLPNEIITPDLGSPSGRIPNSSAPAPSCVIATR
ncbi:hypothetical protein, partial [Streptomyces sp. A 4/2]|uniref:hypothetical protein n=1 Tax=Streptomyces sp. A 4/2 TaxID=2934314 RepID=UPI002025559B